MKNCCIFALQNNGGTIAQLVEQWTENPCVASSNLAGTTKGIFSRRCLFCFKA